MTGSSLDILRTADKIVNLYQTWSSGFLHYIQSTLGISKSKGPSKTVRDIRTSTYQICSIEEKKFEQPNFTNDYVI